MNWLSWAIGFQDITISQVFDGEFRGKLLKGEK